MTLLHTQVTHFKWVICVRHSVSVFEFIIDVGCLSRMTDEVLIAGPISLC